MKKLISALAAAALFATLNRGRVTVPPLFHRLCLSNLHIIYGCCSFAAPISFSWHIDK